jgi:arylmalonate decarboxylase
VDKGAVADLFEMTPPDVNVTIHTNFWSLKMVNKDRFDPARFAGLIDDLVPIAQDLVRYQAPDCIAVTGDLIQAAMGVEWNLELARKVQAATNRPAQTSMTAVADALRFLGAQRVAVASPYREEHRGYSAGYLKEAGFEVLAVEGHETNSLQEIRALPHDAPFQTGRRAFEAAPGAQAIFLACPVWTPDHAIEPLEQACDVPVEAGADDRGLSAPYQRLRQAAGERGKIVRDLADC